jgi:hypothetical protein
LPRGCDEGTLSRVLAPAKKDLEAEVPIDTEGTALTEAGLGGINDALLGDDDSTGNVDDGGNCAVHLEDPTHTLHDEDEDELFGRLDEEEEMSGMLEAQEEEQDPEEA